MRCIVFGGNGFIGSHVVDELASLGHTVTAFDRFSDGATRYRATGVRRIVGDFLNVGQVTAAIEEHDVIYHLVSMSHPASSESDPLLDIRTNVTSSIELFRAAAEAGVEHVYFASTGGAIYGELAGELVDETMRPDPISPYAIGKLTLERYLAYFQRIHGLQSTALRISNPYGPRQSPNRRQGVIPIFLRNLHEGRPLTVYGDGTMLRDYIYVQDLARMIVAPLGRRSEHSLYNVGSGVSYSLNEILAAINRVTDMVPQTIHAPTPPTFVHRIRLDTTRFKESFGELGSLLELDEGIERTWREIAA